MKSLKILIQISIYFFILVFLVLFAAACIPNSGTKTSSPEEVIDFSLADLEGNTVNFSDFRGNVVIVDFWSTSCPPCILEIPHFIDLYNTYSLEGLEIIGITMYSGSVQDVAQKVRELNINYTILMGNDEVARMFGNVRSFPTTFLLDKQGKIQKKYLGYRPKETFEEDMKALF